jgi:hypothetical protein
MSFRRPRSEQTRYCNALQEVVEIARFSKVAGGALPVHPVFARCVVGLREFWKVRDLVQHKILFQTVF